MIITKEIPVEQAQDLDLHQGDSLVVLAEKESSFLIRIVRAIPFSTNRERGSAGAWARQYAGIAQLEPEETNAEVRAAHYQNKYGIQLPTT